MKVLISNARYQFHERLFRDDILTVDSNGIASNADVSNKASKAIVKRMLEILREEGHIVAVTAEPMPSRLASLALGTGNID